MHLILVWLQYDNETYPGWKIWTRCEPLRHLLEMTEYWRALILLYLTANVAWTLNLILLLLYNYEK